MKLQRSSLYKALAPFLLITILYVFAHGVVAMVIAPIQAVFFPNITIFACFLYLPHGIRILAALFYGWPSVIALTAGNVIAAYLFSTETEHFFKDGLVFVSSFAGAMTGILAFELMRFLGFNLYARGAAIVNWKMILVVGAISSVMNSIFTSYIFSGVILPDYEFPVFIAIFVGDIAGVAVLMFMLMYGFRWYRIRRERA